MTDSDSYSLAHLRFYICFGPVVDVLCCEGHLLLKVLHNTYKVQITQLQAYKGDVLDKLVAEEEQQKQGRQQQPSVDCLQSNMTQSMHKPKIIRRSTVALNQREKRERQADTSIHTHTQTRSRMRISARECLPVCCATPCSSGTCRGRAGHRSCQRRCQ